MSFNPLIDFRPQALRHMYGGRIEKSKTWKVPKAFEIRKVDSVVTLRGSPKFTNVEQLVLVKGDNVWNEKTVNNFDWEENKTVRKTKTLSERFSEVNHSLQDFQSLKKKTAEELEIDMMEMRRGELKISEEKFALLPDKEQRAKPLNLRITIQLNENDYSQLGVNRCNRRVEILNRETRKLKSYELFKHNKEYTSRRIVNTPAYHGWPLSLKDSLGIHPGHKRTWKHVLLGWKLKPRWETLFAFTEVNKIDHVPSSSQMRQIVKESFTELCKREKELARKAAKEAKEKEELERSWKTNEQQSPEIMSTSTTIAPLARLINDCNSSEVHSDCEVVTPVNSSAQTEKIIDCEAFCVLTAEEMIEILTGSDMRTFFNVEGQQELNENEKLFIEYIQSLRRIEMIKIFRECELERQRADKNQ